MKFKKNLLSRTFSTAKLSTRLGIGAAKKLLNIDPSDPEKAIKTAVKLAKEFDSMKGLTMKFGQMASYMGTHLPKEAREALATLQAQSTALEFEAVKSIIESELGKPIEECFDHFEESAFAAASIGQVHRAKIGDQEVAVKVQYPDIEQLLDYDIKLIGGLFTAIMAGSPTDGRALANELLTILMEECDYEKEAAHQSVIRQLVLEHSEHYPTLSVPAIIPSHSTKRLLTSEFVDGMDFNSFKMAANQTAKNRAAEAIFKFSMDSIFRHCFFNGDPHPGNYLFKLDGSVTLLDFGCIKKFPLPFIRQWKTMAQTVIHQEVDHFRDTIMEMGFVAKPEKFDFEFHWETVNAIYEPYLSETPYTYTPKHTAEINRYLLWENKNRFAFAMPSDLLFANRLQWGLVSILTDLSAESVWRSVFEPAVFAEPVPLFE